MRSTPVLTGLQPYKTTSKAAAVRFQEHESETTSIAPDSETDCYLSTAESLFMDVK